MKLSWLCRILCAAALLVCVGVADADAKNGGGGGGDNNPTENNNPPDNNTPDTNNNNNNETSNDDLLDGGSNNPPRREMTGGGSNKGCFVIRMGTKVPCYFYEPPCDCGGKTHRW